MRPHAVQVKKTLADAQHGADLVAERALRLPNCVEDGQLSFGADRIALAENVAYHVVDAVHE